MKPKFISLGFLAALGLPIIWVAVLFAFGLQAHRQKVQHQMRQNQLALTTFVFSEEEFNALEWEHAKEFKYRGQMYDVQAICRTTSEIEVQVYKDLAEMELIKFFRKAVKSTLGKGENSKEQSQLVGLWLKSLYFPPQHLELALPFSDLKRVMTYHYQIENPARDPQKIFHPPCV